jgi:hypothetical protein
LEDPPLAINHGLPPRVARQAETVALAWATRNRDALLSFWRDGLTWDSDDVQAFIERLARVP